jgi:hypothetical protein
MPKCALCESTQSLGDACDVCGRPFPAAEAVPVPIEPLPGLEGTRHDATSDDPRVERLTDLVPTAERAGGFAAPLDRIEGFSPTAAEPVTVEVTPLEVERVGEEALLDARDALDPAAQARVTCRYCRTPAIAGERLCAVCGMRLPLVRTPRAAGADGAEPCRDCGIPMTGSQCPACGARRSPLR